jgi:hypothetical protein
VIDQKDGCGEFRQCCTACSTDTTAGADEVTGSSENWSLSSIAVCSHARFVIILRIGAKSKCRMVSEPRLGNLCKRHRRSSPIMIHRRRVI